MIELNLLFELINLYNMYYTNFILMN